jgi:hypothetical protein
LPRRLIAVYMAVVVIVSLARAVSGHPRASALALTPDRLAAGKLWLFATSGVIVNGPWLPQAVALVATLVAAVRRLGAAFVAVVALAAHVGATLLAYAALAVFTGDADGAHNRNLDYGTSAVWLGVLGALTVALLPAARNGDRRARVVVGLGLAAFIIGATAFPLLASTEHAFAFAIGAAAAAVRAPGGWRVRANPQPQLEPSDT